MTSIQFVVHPLPGTQEQLQEKLKEVADRLNKYNSPGKRYRYSLPVFWVSSIGITLTRSWWYLGT